MSFCRFLRQSTAVDVLIGPFVDSTDGDTAETALTIAAADVRLSKNGQNMAAKNDATACVHDEEGMYNCELDATDTNTVGSLVLLVHESGALHVRHEYQVLEEAVYDALFDAGATGDLDVNVASISGDSVAADNCESFFDGTGYAGTGNTIPTVTTLTGHTAQTGDSFARLGAPAGASVSADIAAIESQTDDIGVAGAGLSAIPWNAAWDAEVQSEVNDALVALGLDHLVSASVTGTDITNNSIIAYMVSSAATADWDTFVNTDDSLQAISESGGGGPTAADIADAVWDELQADHTTVGTFGVIASEIATILARIPQTLNLTASGNIGIDWANVENPTTALDLSGTDIQLCDTVTTNTDMRGTDSAATAANLATVDNNIDSLLTQVPQKNQALSDIPFFMVDETDHITPETGLTVTVTRSLDGAAFAATTGSVTELANGAYSFDASAADMNGDSVVFQFAATGADNAFVHFKTRT